MLLVLLLQVMVVLVLNVKLLLLLLIVHDRHKRGSVMVLVMVMVLLQDHRVGSGQDVMLVVRVVHVNVEGSRIWRSNAVVSFAVIGRSMEFVSQLDVSRSIFNQLQSNTLRAFVAVRPNDALNDRFETPRRRWRRRRYR